jgi:hypothetical protein
MQEGIDYKFLSAEEFHLQSSNGHNHFAKVKLFNKPLNEDYENTIYLAILKEKPVDIYKTIIYDIIKFHYPKVLSWDIMVNFES